jgi:hypothetical protein
MQKAVCSSIFWKINKMSIPFIPARVEEIKAKIKAREGKKEYAENVKFLKAELARITTKPDISTGTASLHGTE